MRRRAEPADARALVRFMVEQHFIPKAVLVDELFLALRGARGN